MIEEPDKWSCHGLDTLKAYSQVLLNASQIGSVGPKHTMLDLRAPFISFNVNLRGDICLKCSVLENVRGDAIAKRFPTGRMKMEYTASGGEVPQRSAHVPKISQPVVT